MQTKFCSQTSINISENLFGTATKFNRLVLIEYAHPWGVNPFIESKIETTVKEYLNNLLRRKAIERILLIKNKSSSQNKINIYVINNKEDSPFLKHYVISTYTELLDIDLEHSINNNSDILKTTLYLVCTNGKKDMCCSKFGLPFFNKLDNIGTDIWQCTHIGGDRFAPNVLTLPYGHFYGHLEAEEVSNFYGTTKEHKIYFKKYRGRSCYGNKEQSAEYFLRNKLQDYLVDSLKLIESSHTFNDTVKVKFFNKSLTTYFNIDIKTKKSNERFFLTCKAQKQSSIDLFDLISITQAS